MRMLLALCHALSDGETHHRDIGAEEQFVGKRWIENPRKHIFSLVRYAEQLEWVLIPHGKQVVVDRMSRDILKRKREIRIMLSAVVQ